LISISDIEFATTIRFHERQEVLSLPETDTAGIADAYQADTMRPTDKVKRAPNLILECVVRLTPLVNFVTKPFV
jgi:hypothetical protein